MKTTIRVILSLLVFSGQLFARANSAEQEIRQLEEERRLAVLHGDQNVLSRLYAPDMVVIDRSGEIHFNTTGESVRLNGPANRTTTRWDTDEFRVKVYGDTAIVTQRAHITDVIHGQPRDFVARLTHVWVKRDGAWKLVLRQGTQIRQP